MFKWSNTGNMVLFNTLLDVLDVLDVLDEAV